jgi:hypothetical protein
MTEATRFAQQFHQPRLQHACPNSSQHVLTAVAFEQHALDALPV